MSLSGDTGEAALFDEMRKMANERAVKPLPALGPGQVFLTPQNVANRLNVTRAAVLRAISTGRLQAYKVKHKVWLVHPDDYQAFYTARGKA